MVLMPPQRLSGSALLASLTCTMRFCSIQYMSINGQGVCGRGICGSNTCDHLFLVDHIRTHMLNCGARNIRCRHPAHSQCLCCAVMIRDHSSSSVASMCSMRYNSFWYHCPALRVMRRAGETNSDESWSTNSGTVSLPTHTIVLPLPVMKTDS